MSKDEWTIERDEDLTGPYAFKDKMWIAFEDKISVAIKVGARFTVFSVFYLCVRNDNLFINVSGKICSDP